MQQKNSISYFKCGMPHISFHKVPMCVLFRFFPPKMCWMSSPIHTNQKIEKILNPIVFPSKFEGTLHTLDLEFPSVIENKIQMRNT
jgi:hypothetical protein